MEETKLDDSPPIPQGCNNLEVPQWEWQSDSDPFKETDPSKWTWKNYSDDENLIIEKAYSLNQEIADLKDYEIDLKKMLQVNKQDRNKIRSVRRQGLSRFMMDVPEAKVITKDPKTMNEAFGTVQQFLEYIMKRTPEAYTLYQRLKTFSMSRHKISLEDGFEDLVHQVVVCIEKGAEARAKVIKTRTGSCKAPNYIEEAREITNMIEKNGLSFRGFLNAILKAYTMETFVCYWLNQLLRSEDWEEMNILTPYLVCLLYTFKLPDYILKDQSSQKAINDKLGFVVKHRLFLYRGAALTEEQLVSYNPNRIKYFSWNAVTSTSRDPNIAEKYVYLSLNETKKIGVIFFIEIDFDSIEDYHGMIDISKDSRYPQEQEVILAPGTVFQLLDISLIKNDIYGIRLKITKVPNESHENEAPLGLRQDQAISSNRAIIDGLPSQKNLKMLRMLRANTLIQKLEIKNSGIDKHIMQEIESVRETTNVRKEDIRLIGNTISVDNLSALNQYFSLSNLSEILSLNRIRFESEILKSDHQITVKNLMIKDETIEMFHNNGQLKELWSVLKNEIQILEISLLIEKTQIFDQELLGFFECLQEWKSLEHLVLSFSEDQKISLDNFSLLCQAISSSITLKKLSFKFSFSEEELSLLRFALSELTCLHSLSLDFNGDNRISDQGFSHLNNAFLSLTSLHHLSLRFEGCDKISDQEMDYLTTGIAFITSLQHLSLDFVGCSFSDEGMDCLSREIASLTSLQHLHLGLRSCNHISDEGLESLKNGLASLTALQHLSCDLSACRQISSEGLNSLMAQFTFPSSLKHCFIDVKFCLQSSDKDLNYLKSAFASFKIEQQMSLDLILSNQITSQSLHHFKKTLESLSYLYDLSLDFRDCKGILDAGLDFLTGSLSFSRSLQNLSLNLKDNNRISDEGLNYLKSNLIPLTSLNHLSLNFESCNLISDVALSHLKDALISFTSLKYLSLCFGYCELISDEGLNRLKSGLISLISLEHLSLDFWDCFRISDKGLDHLSKSLLPLTSLNHLAVNFGFCNKISDEGLHHLTRGLILLTYLEQLSLDFGNCNKVSDEGLNHLKGGLRSLRSLHSFTAALQKRFSKFQQK